jgi:hypothetical protein
MINDKFANVIAHLKESTMYALKLKNVIIICFASYCFDIKRFYSSSRDNASATADIFILRLQLS